MSKQLTHTGLSSVEVSASRAAHGVNVLTPAAKTPLWQRFLEKFSDPLIIILMVAGLLSVGISVYEYYGLDEGGTVFFEPVGIFIAILLATGLSFYFEVKADKEFEILNKVNDDEPVQVIRDGGAVMEVPRRDIVVGDIIVINTGDEVPADAQLLEAVALTVDESTLTGEPSCDKTTDEAHFDSEATFPSDAVMRGTKVLEGHGVARVTAVGDATENGKVFTAAQIEEGAKTPLSEQLERLGHLISTVSYCIAAAILVGRLSMYFVYNDFEWLGFLAHALQTVMIAVTLIVVAVPEGLPMAVTLSLAYSMRRMLKTNNLVRKMHACETMGATTVICTDKTGTLTRNQMRVREAAFFGVADGRLESTAAGRLIAEGIAVNSTARLDLTGPAGPKALGNPTEGALLLWLHDQGIDYSELKSATELIEELPFSTERKYMATVVRSADGIARLYVKGAPEILLGMCRNIAGGVSRAEIDGMLTGYQAQAMRTLGFAVAEVSPGSTPIAEERIDVDNLTFLGIVAISDPVRDDVPDAVKECLDAGIGIKVVTGDTVGTASEIGRQIGLWGNDDATPRSIITGPEFAALSDAELDDRVMELKIIARARPLDKKRLVEALQAKGAVVAVTGDGTNDAPALKAAHVGLSMGDGTSVAKEASDITIIDNSFASIGRAVMWGRSLFLNIRRFVLFQMTVNVVACLIVLCGAFIGTESPLTVTQMLWVNLIMDTFAAMALASLPPSRSVMKEKPRRREDFIINRPMWWSIIGTGGVFFLLLLGLLWWFKHTDITSLSGLFSAPRVAGHELSGYELSLFFTIFVFLQFWNMFNARAFATGRSALHLGGCGAFVFIAVTIFVGQILLVTFGGRFFTVMPLHVTDWIIIIIATSPVLLIGELHRIACGR